MLDLNNKIIKSDYNLIIKYRIWDCISYFSIKSSLFLNSKQIGNDLISSYQTNSSSNFHYKHLSLTCIDSNSINLDLWKKQTNIYLWCKNIDDMIIITPV